MVGTGRISVQGIDEIFWSEFKDSVRERCGKLHTALGLEVEKALKLYQEGFSQTGDTHTHQKKEESKQKEKEKKQKIPKGIVIGKTRAERINNVGKMLMYGSEEISDAGVQRLITSQQVGDERVIESYIQTMKLRGWLMAKGRNTGMAVLRSTISKALDVPLPRETLEKMVESYKMPQVEGNGGRY